MSSQIDLETTTLPERIVAAMLAEDRASHALGMRTESVNVGSASVSMLVREDMLNGHGSCHGGLMFALADTAFAFACNSHNRRAVAAGCQIDFLKPAFVGDKLIAAAVELSVGSRLGLYDVAITNQNGETVALFRGRSCAIRGEVIPQGSEERPLEAED